MAQQVEVEMAVHFPLFFSGEGHRTAFDFLFQHGKMSLNSRSRISMAWVIR
jgi:hypothetical protein